ncbi:substrate-binding domain-containing protein [Gorillibacterium sp. sgz5001074]|uniref:substrate-binding domain-containing protein n=1 Tax=Gorillibacterium sp. sgz5001074 TaxID=3446695 RepID=UPI003F67833C
MKRVAAIYLVLVLIFGLYVIQYLYKDTRGPVIQEGIKGSIDEKYVMVTFQAGIEYWKSCLKGFEDAAEALNVSVEYRGATQYDLKEQITVLEHIIARKPAGIALSAINPQELSSTIDKAVEAGIPVVLFDSGAVTSKAYSFLATDNVQAGVAAARKMADILSGSGKVAVITQPNQLNHQERTQGFMETIRKEFPRIEIAAVEDGKGDSLSSKMTMLEVLRNHPDLSGVFVTYANGGVGVAEALSVRQDAGRVKIVSFDTDKQTLDLVKQGTISATMAQGTWNMGYWSLQFLFHVKHGLAKPGSSANQGVSTLPPYVDTGITVVTGENVDRFYAK